MLQLATQNQLELVLEDSGISVNQLDSIVEQLDLAIPQTADGINFSNIWKFDTNLDGEVGSADLLSFLIAYGAARDTTLDDLPYPITIY